MSGGGRQKNGNKREGHSSSACAPHLRWLKPARWFPGLQTSQAPGRASSPGQPPLGLPAGLWAPRSGAKVCHEGRGAPLPNPTVSVTSGKDLIGQPRKQRQNFESTCHSGPASLNTLVTTHLNLEIGPPSDDTQSCP